MSTTTTATEISGGGGGGGSPTGAAGGDLGGTYPNPTVDDDGHAHTSATVTPAGIGAAPSTVDYLVGTASGGLSAEIAVGTTPGGELGGTWASPTVDATHSGSAHHTRSHDHSNASDGTALAPVSVAATGDITAAGLVESDSGDLEALYYAADAFGPGVYLSKSRNAAVGGHTVVHDDDVLGEMVAYGSDGAAFRKGGRVAIEVDGTPGSSDMPGRIVFETTSDGSATPTERMRIDATGVVDVTGTLKQGGTSVSLSGHSHSTDFGEDADISTQAMGDSPSAGSTGEVADAGHKHGMPSFGASAAAVGTSAAGVATTPSRSDHVHATGAGTPVAVSTANAIGSGPAAAMTDHVHAHETAHLAHDTLWDAAGDLVVGSGADTAAKLGLTVPAANILNVLGVVNGETTPTWKSVHDGTAPAAIGTAAAGTALTASHRDHVHATGAGTPSTQAFGDAASTGSGPAAAMTDHKHAMPANPVTGAAIAPSSVHATGSVIADTTVQSNGGDLEAIYNAADAFGAGVYLSKSRNTTIGAHTIVQANDIVGEMVGYGSNGSAFQKAARIGIEIDGTPGAGSDMPGRIVFQTTPDGSATPATAVTIDNAKLVTVATALKIGSGSVYPVGSSVASTQAFADAAAAGTATESSRTDHKHAMPTLGYGHSGNSAPAVALTTEEVFATAETTLSTAAYADISGATTSSLAAGTWLILATINGRVVNAHALMVCAITNAANTVMANGVQSIPASGTASVNAHGQVTLSAIVTGGTSYKIRGARGNTTLTTSWIAMDGASLAIANNASDNTDKGTSIRALRVA